MPIIPTMIATAFASEGLDEIWHLLAFACWCSAAVFGLIALILCLTLRKHRLKAIWVSLAGGLLSRYPILFAHHVYRIDFVPVGGDGTPASPPLIFAMAFPLMPLGVCLLAAGIACARHGRGKGDHGKGP